MEQYDFTLRFSLAQNAAEPEEFVAALLAEGCTDALIGLGITAGGAHQV